ncbi:MAG: DUF4919 domain-containing protein [Rhizomicrobium sp.]|jgi:hypothetical protein
MFGRIAVVMCGLLAAVPCAQADDGALPSYDVLLSQLKSGFTDIDYAQLRNAYATSAGYAPYFRGGEDERALAEGLQKSDCAKVLGAANRILVTNFTNIAAHVYAAECSRKLNDRSSAQYHRTVAQGLLGSIARSGDGEAPQSAYVVVSVDEEMAFLDAGGMKFVGKSLVQFGAHECDAVDVTDDSGAKKTIYFNVDRPWAWLAQRFPPNSRDKSAAAAVQ